MLYASSPSQTASMLDRRRFHRSSFVSSLFQSLVQKLWKNREEDNEDEDDDYCDSDADHSHQQGAEVPGTVRYVYNTCVLVDCAQWLDSMAACTKARFPDVEIRVQQSQSSLTGFCIVLRLQPDAVEDTDYELIASASHAARSSKDRRATSSWWQRKFQWLGTITLVPSWRSHALGAIVLCGILQCARVAVQGTISAAASAKPDATTTTTNTTIKAEL